MLCLAVAKLPEGPAWQYAVKLDGYRAIAVRTKTGVELWSRNKKDHSHGFRGVARALETLPVETALDGEIVADNGDGQPSFSWLQNFGDGAAAILFYVFDAPVLAGADLRSKPLATRGEVLRELISKLPDTIRFSETFDASASELMAAVRSNGLEGVVAKRRDSSYKPGDRSGAWLKVRANRGQELVIGGYIPGSTTFDSVLVAYYEGKRSNVCGPNSERPHATLPSDGILEFREPVDLQMPVSESPRIGKGQMGRRPDRRRHEEMPLARTEKDCPQQVHSLRLEHEEPNSRRGGAQTGET
jgi:bifunctional non-homologous end joining protein LigD